MTRTLIRGATIVTMDAQGDLPAGDILVEGDTLAAIAPRIEAGDAQLVDASECIAIPGLVNAHMHTWQTALRGLAANWTLLEYFQKMHAGLATVFQPEDLHIATLVGALNQLNCGTTTLADWCHNNKTPAHNDAAIEGLLQSGIRAAFFHGTPKPDPKPGEAPFWEVPHPRAEVERLLKAHQGREQLSIQAAVLGPHYSTLEVALHDFRMARELGLIASLHQGGGPARTPEGWQRLEAEGLLGEHINIVHGHALSDAQLQRFCELGISFSAAAESEMSQGHGYPITGRLRSFGRAPSLGVDLESVMSGDMLSQARIALGMQRSLDNAAWREAHGTIPPTSTITTREALGWVTTEGARMLKQSHRIGSLAAGKQADLVLIRTSDLNMQPVHDPVSTVVMQTTLANIDSVMVAGQWKKREGRLLGVELAPKLAALRASGRKIAGALGLAGALVASAAAQGSYPSKPIRFLVPFTAGSGTDVIARTVGDTMARGLGQPIVIENKPGAGGTIAAAQVAKGEADGYTVLIHSSSHAVNPAIYPNLSFDTLKDLTGVTPLASLPNVMVVSPERGWKTVADVVAAAKAKPGQLNYASAGIGSATHLNAEKFKLQAGFDAVHVPFKGTPEAVSDVIGGRTDWYFAPLSAALPLIKDGKLQALAVSTPQRTAALPQLPTTVEAGVPGSDYIFWVAMIVASGTPPAIVRRLNEEALKALANPEVRERMAKLGAEPLPMSPEAFNTFIRSEMEAAARVAKAANLKAQ